MDTLVICTLLALGALLSPCIGPYALRAVFLLARLTRRGGGSPEAGVPTNAVGVDTAYRDSKDTRIRALEAQLEDNRAKLARAETLIEELRERVRAAKRAAVTRRRPEAATPWARGLMAAGCVVASTMAVIGGLSLLPSRPAEPGWHHRIEPLPTMAPALATAMRTSGGELPVALPRTYVVVLLFPPYDGSRCYDGRLVIEPTFTIMEPSEGEWVRILWLLAAFEPSEPPSFLRL